MRSLLILPLMLIPGCASRAPEEVEVPIYQQVTYTPPEVCLRGPVDVPAPVVRAAYPDQAKNPKEFWQALAADIKQTAILRSGALETANERLVSCKASLPNEAPIVLEVEPK